MIAHDAPCGGRVLFEGRGQALARLARAGERPPDDPHREFRILYCDACGKTWPSKREMWAEAHTEEDA